MRKALALFLFTLTFTVGAFAQAVAGLGAISGTVRDASGGVVPNATVVISNGSKGINRTMQTTDAGVFSAPALPPSSGYAVSVSKDGFSKWEAKDFEILVGQTVDFSVNLKVGSTSQQVEVTGEAPLVEANKSGVSQVVERGQIEDLPINGRRADTFVLLTPAVTDDGSFGLVSFRGIAGGNAFLTDGNDTTQSFYNENAGRTRISTQISQDAVQEFQVLSNGFSAEFGRAMGGVINTVTKGGSNQTHGSLYEYFRNRTLNAADRYANGFNLPEWRHQAGGSIGGAIKKDKLFYFASFEMVKRNFPALNRIINTNIMDGAGNMARCDATAAQCATAFAFITRQNNVLVPRTVDSQMGFVRLDWNATPRNTVSASTNIMHWDSPNGIQTQAVLSSGNALGNNANSTVETRYGKLAWTSVPTPTMVNDFRFGWFKDRLSDSANSSLFPKETGAVYIGISGSSGTSTIGGPQAYPRTQPSEQRLQFVDNLSWTRGAHSMKFGIDFQRTEDYIDQIYNRNGAYSYSNLTSFAKDFANLSGGAPVRNFSNFQQAFGSARQDIFTKDINVYAQDVWKVSRKLTLNYGIRYEHTWIPQPWITNPDYPSTGKINSPTKNFSPRFSVSYAFDDKTVLRAGYGIFWARFHGNGLDTLLLGNGKFQPSIYVFKDTVGAPAFPNVVLDPGNLPPSTINLQFASKDFHNPYTQQGTIAIERQLGRDLGFTASYIWSRGIGIWTQRDMNLAPATESLTYTIYDASGAVAGLYATPAYTKKLDGRYGKILQVENGGQSWYNGLALQLRKRFSHNFSANVSYTWSHAIDDADMQGASWNIGWNYNNVTTPGDYSADKGSSTTDQRHRVSVDWRWAPKFTSSTSALSRYLVNGWELSTITTLGSSHPNSATVNVVNTAMWGNGTGLPKLAYSSMNGSGGWNRVPFWPVNSLDVDTYHRVDARIVRQLPFSEKVKAGLMFEAFNVFNTITNTSITTQAYTADYKNNRPELRPSADLGAGTASQGFPDGTNARRMQVALRITF